MVLSWLDLCSVIFIHITLKSFQFYPWHKYNICAKKNLLDHQNIHFDYIVQNPLDDDHTGFQIELMNWSAGTLMMSSSSHSFGGGDNFVFSGNNAHFFDKICIIFLIIDDSQFWTINGRNLQIWHHVYIYMNIWLLGIWKNK